MRVPQFDSVDTAPMTANPRRHFISVYGLRPNHRRLPLPRDRTDRRHGYPPEASLTPCPLQTLVNPRKKRYYPARGQWVPEWRNWQTRGIQKPPQVRRKYLILPALTLTPKKRLARCLALPALKPPLCPLRPYGSFKRSPTFSRSTRVKPCNERGRGTDL